MFLPPNLEPNAKMMWHHTHLLLGFAMRFKSPMTTSGDLFGKPPVAEKKRKRLYDTKAVNRKFPVGSWVLRYYPPAAQHKLGSPWVGPHQVVRQATGHTVGIQRSVDKPIIFVHVDDLKLCPGPQEISWTPNVSTAKSLCASTVAFRPGSDIGEVTPDPSVDVSAWGDEIDLHQDSIVQKDLDKPIDLTGHILSPFYQR